MNSNRDSAAFMAASFGRRPGDEVTQCWPSTAALSREKSRLGSPAERAAACIVSARCSFGVVHRPRATAPLRVVARCGAALAAAGLMRLDWGTYSWRESAEALPSHAARELRRACSRTGLPPRE